MSIDEAIKQFKEDAEYNRADLDLEWAEENEQVAEWLEELKYHKSLLENTKTTNPMYEIGYNKAIDDYRNSIKEELNRFDVKNLDTCVLFDFMDRKAEKLKAGVKNDC